MRKWFQELKEFLEDSKRLKGMERVKHIWSYYWIPIISVLLALTLLIWAVVRYATTPKDNWFYAMFCNLSQSTDADENSDLYKDFVEFSGYDTSEKEVFFNNNSYFAPGKSFTGNDYYTYFCAYVDAGTLDVVLMEKDDLQNLGAYGRLLDLDSDKVSELEEKYQDRLIYAVPNDTDTYGSDPVPIGIDLSDSLLVTKYHLYDTCAMGIGMYAEHIDAIETFLDFVLGGSK